MLAVYQIFSRIGYNFDAGNLGVNRSPIFGGKAFGRDTQQDDSISKRLARDFTVSDIGKRKFADVIVSSAEIDQHSISGVGRDLNVPKAKSTGIRRNVP